MLIPMTLRAPMPPYREGMGVYLYALLIPQRITVWMVAPASTKEGRNE